MPASNLKKKNFAGEFLKRSGSLVTNAAKDYFTEVMPVTGSIMEGATKAFSSTATKLKNTTNSILTSAKSLKSQANIKNILNWYMGESDEFDMSDADLEASLDFDIDTDDVEISQAQISETEITGNKISKSIVESTLHSVESNVEMTANIITSLDKQTAVITSGFDKVSELITQLTEVVTKNTSSAIEATITSSNKEDVSANDKMVGSGKFNLEDYFKAVKENIDNDSSLGMLSSAIDMLHTIADSMKEGPDVAVSMIFSAMMDKLAPTLREGLSSFDSAINDTIMTGLLRLGERDDMIGKMFGLHAERKEISGKGLGNLEIKSIPFDTITKEAITQTIPGYLQKIYNVLSGEDLIYDNRSRSFKSKEDITNEFRENAAADESIRNASEGVRRAFGTDEFSTMTYDLLMTELGKHIDSANDADKPRNKLTEFRNIEGSFTEYMQNIFAQNSVALSDAEKERLDLIGRNIANSSNSIAVDMANQAAMMNVNRNNSMRSYIQNAQEYGVDLSDMRTDANDEIRTILNRGGKAGGTSQISEKGTKRDLDSGVAYTNKALFEIFRILDRGVNVYQLGSIEKMKGPFQKTRALLPPKGYRSKEDQKNRIPETGAEEEGGMAMLSEITRHSSEEDPNMLRAQYEIDEETGEVKLDENGNPIPTKSGGERFKEWAKYRGANIRDAVFSGDPEQIRAALGGAIRDVAEIAGDKVKEGAAKINDSFGNVTGFIKSKLFGTEYSYKDKDENGNDIIVTVPANEKGGVFGFIKDNLMESFNKVKDKGKEWFNSVKGYFEFGKDDPDAKEKGAKEKRSKFLAASIGAFAGAGILGAPIGMLVGGLVGSAVSGLNIGGRLKNFLFGRDEETGKAKGVLSKLHDAVIDPIKFQFQKTFSYFGGLLKKNLLGPIADIGHAIRDRVKEGFDNTIGKAFKFIGRTLMAPFKAAGKLLMLPFKLLTKGLGSLTRGTAKLGSEVTGFGLNSIASIIAGKSKHRTADGEEISTREWLKNRRKERSEEFKNEHGWWRNRFARDEEGNIEYEEEPGLFGIRRRKRNDQTNFKAWQTEQNKKRAAKRKEFQEYIKPGEEIIRPADEANGAVVSALEDTAEAVAETTSAVNETNESIQEGNEVSRETNASVSTMEHHATELGSLYTHDAITHEKLNQIISLIGGEAKLSDGEPEGSTRLSDEIENANSSIGTVEGASLTLPGETNVSRTFNNVAEAKPAEELISGEATSDTMLSAAVIAGSEGGYSKDDTRNIDKMIDESAKKDSDENKMADSLKAVIHDQPARAEEKEEKEETIFDKIANWISGSGLLGNIGEILLGVAGIAGLLSILNSIFGDGNFNLGSIISSIGDRIGNLFDKFFNRREDEDATEAGINAVTETIADAGSDNWAESILPGGQLYHSKRDANGDAIVNQNATILKDEALYINPAKQDVMQWAHATDSVSYQSAKITDLTLKKSAATNKIFELETELAKHPQGSAEYKDISKKIAKEEKKIAKYDEKLGKANEKMGNANEGAEISKGKVKTGTLERVVNAGAQLGITYAAGSAAGAGAEFIAKNLGVNDQAAAGIGEGANTLVSGFITANETKALFTGKETWLQKAASKTTDTLKEIGSKLLEGIKNIINAIVDGVKDKFGKSVGQKFAQNAPGEAAELVSRLTTGEAGEMMVRETEKATAKNTAKEIATKIPVIELLAAAAFGLIGWADGIAGAAHLFMVRNVDVDDDMRNISATLKTILGVAGALPIASYFAVLIEAAGVVMNAFGIPSLLTMFATMIYNAIKGSDVAINAKQKRFNEALEDYNSKNPNVKLNAFEFNDKVNNASALSLMINGDVAMDPNDMSKYWYDESGQDFVRNSKFQGNHKQYMRDDTGAILTDDQGHAVKLVDKYGNLMKYDYNMGDAFGAAMKDLGNAFGVGRAVYKTDETGAAIVDEHGKYVIDHYESGVFGGIADLFSGGAVSKANADIARNNALAEKYKFMPTEKDEQEWYEKGADPTMLSASEMREKIVDTNPEYKRLWDEGGLEKLPTEIAAQLAWASMNERVLWRIYEEMGLDSDTIEKTIAESRRTGVAKIPTVPNSKENGATVTPEEKEVKSEVDSYIDQINGDYTQLAGIAESFTDRSAAIINRRKGATAAGATTAEGIGGEAEGYVSDTVTEEDAVISDTIFDENGNPLIEMPDHSEVEAMTADAADMRPDLSPITDMMGIIASTGETITSILASILSEFNKFRAETMEDVRMRASDMFDLVSDKIANVLNNNWVKVSDQKMQDKLDRVIDRIAVIQRSTTNIFSSGLLAPGIDSVLTGNLATTDTSFSVGPEPLSSKINHYATAVKGGEAEDYKGDNAFPDDKSGTTIDMAKGGEVPGAPSNIQVGDDGEITQEAAQAFDELPSMEESELNSQQGGNPLSKPATMTLAYGNTTASDAGYSSSRPHAGIDLVPADGTQNVDVVSRWNGYVTYTRDTIPWIDKSAEGSTGNNVSILTKDENGQEFTVRHMHLKQHTIPKNIEAAADAYKKGDLENAKVHVGDKLGEMGNTGYTVGSKEPMPGAHLHYQFNKGNYASISPGEGTLDPTASFYGGTSVSNVSNSGTPNSQYTTATTAVTTGATTSATDDGNNSALSNFVSKLTEYAQDFLYNITGGIIGKKREENTSAANLGNEVYVGDTASPSVNPTTSSTKVRSAEEFMKIVRGEVGKGEVNADGYNEYTSTMYYELAEAFMKACESYDQEIEAYKQTIIDKAPKSDVLLMVHDDQLNTWLVRLNDGYWYDTNGKEPNSENNLDKDNPMNIAYIQTSYSPQAYQECYEMELRKEQTGMSDAQSAKLQAFIENKLKVTANSSSHQDATESLSLANRRDWGLAFAWWCFAAGEVEDMMPFRTDDVGKFLHYYVDMYSELKPWKVWNGANLERAGITLQLGDLVFIHDESLFGQYKYFIGFVDEVLNDKYANIIGYRRNCSKPKVEKVKLYYRGKKSFIFRMLNFGNVSTDIKGERLIENGDLETPWAILKALGYTDTQTAGIIGNMLREGGRNIRSKGMEGDFYPSFDPVMYDKLPTDRDAIDTYTKNLVSGYKSNIGAQLKWYEGGDGHYYPGTGLVGFTGPVARDYLEWAEKNGRNWYDAAGQLSYMDNKIRTSMDYPDWPTYKNLRDKFNDPTRNAGDMAKAFFAHYTSGTNNENHPWAEMGAENAMDVWNNYYPQFKDKYPDVPELRIKTWDEEQAEKAAGEAHYGGEAEGYVSDNTVPDIENDMNISAESAISESDDKAEGIGGPIETTPTKSKSGKKKPASVITSTFGNEKPTTTNMKPKKKKSDSVISSSYAVKAKGGATEDYAADGIVPEYNAPSYTPPTFDPTPSIQVPKSDPISTNVTNNIVSPTDLTGVLTMMSQMLSALTNIAGNTGETTGQLIDLNNKDFVDKGLRDTITAVGNAHRKQNIERTSSYSSARTVTALAKP